MQETQVRYLGLEDPLEKGMATSLFLDDKESDMTKQQTLSLWGN